MGSAVICFLSAPGFLGLRQRASHLNRIISPFHRADIVIKGDLYSAEVEEQMGDGSQKVAGSCHAE